jgi:hypothetical protein
MCAGSRLGSMAFASSQSGSSGLRASSKAFISSSLCYTGVPVPASQSILAY